MNDTTHAARTGELQRVVGVGGAVLLGLGSILGTGIFVSIGLAAGATGASVLLAVVAAAFVATFNGLSSAQLAANHPVSGGTYEYGYRYLTPTLGFVAGWTFLCAKSASAATAALGFAEYTLAGLGGPSDYVVPLALAGVAAVTAVVAGGMRRSNSANAVIVGATLVALAIFVFAGAGPAVQGASEHFGTFFAGERPVAGFLEATALVFVSFTGYGRVATLGEEIHEPRRNVPRAIVATLAVTALVYIAVVAVAVGSSGAGRLAEATERGTGPLAALAIDFGSPTVARIVSIGAVTAMLGVLLNLVLGLSRVALAMARRGDLPTKLARVDARRSSPTASVIAVGVLIAALASIGSVRATWSFSAFTVLVYYAITNLAALRLGADERFLPRWVSVAGLVCCLGLAFWVEPAAWIAGAAMIAVGLLVRALLRRR